MRNLLEACIFIEHIPAIIYRAGHFHCAIKIGEAELKLCLPPNIFLAALWNASEAAQEFDEETHGPKVVPLHPHPAIQSV